MVFGIGSKWWGLKSRGNFLVGLVIIISMLTIGAAESNLKQENSTRNETQFIEPRNSMKSQSGYKHVWPEMKVGWRMVVGAIVGFHGAAFGSAGGVGGGGIFVPMLTLIIGFDTKSSAALSKCMITGAAASTVYYNLKLRHPTLEMPVIDYDLALLFQPMLVLGVSVGVALNVIFADWMVTVLLIILFLVMSTKACFKGIETWKKETVTKKESIRHLESRGHSNGEVVYNIPIDNLADNNTQTGTKAPKKAEVSILQNVYWKDLGLLVAVWLMILGFQIAKNYTTTCSVVYWMLSLAQIPVAGGVTSYQAVKLYKGQRKITSKGDAEINWRVSKLILCSFVGLLAGIVGGLLGLGGGFILGPLFLEMGIPPQVSSATATFAMTFSASMSVIEYYLLKRFPVPYALYFFAVATIAGLLGQHVVKKLIDLLGRASIIIFILSFTVFVSALSLGGVGLMHMARKIERKEYMGFDDLCSYAS